MNKVFGVLAAPYRRIVATPVGKPCHWCEEAIADGDRGIVLDQISETGQVSDAVFHSECYLRTVFGSIGHQAGMCKCKGGDFEDPPGFSKRESAKMAATLYALEAAKREVKKS